MFISRIFWNTLIRFDLAVKALYFDKRNKQSASPEAYLGASQKSLIRLSDTSLSTVSYWYYFHFMWSLLLHPRWGGLELVP